MRAPTVCFSFLGERFILLVPGGEVRCDTRTSGAERWAGRVGPSSITFAKYFLVFSHGFDFYASFCCPSSLLWIARAWATIAAEWKWLTRAVVCAVAGSSAVAKTEATCFHVWTSVSCADTRAPIPPFPCVCASNIKSIFFFAKGQRPNTLLEGKRVKMQRKNPPLLITGE